MNNTSSHAAHAGNKDTKRKYIKIQSVDSEDGTRVARRRMSGRELQQEFQTMRSASNHRSPSKFLGEPVIAVAAILLLLGVFVMMIGCGTGGYPGAGIMSLSSSSVTIDAGQSFAVTANTSGATNIAWAMAGTACSGAACGTVSSTSDVGVTYTAPSNLTSQLKLTLTASVAGTSNSKIVSITVNPAPTITGAPGAGVVGTPYSATLVAVGGTAPLKGITVVASQLPAGLTFNAVTGVISGTPTTVGTFTFTAQVIDSSDVPFTATVKFTITISASSTGTTLSISGTTPAGIVGTPYGGVLTASGGTGPYTFTVLSGTLPAGLTLSAAGAISGTPTTAGTSTFTAQVQDSTGTKASGSFTIVVSGPVVPPLTLTVTSLPNGTVGTPYTATIGVSGGTAPYACSITAGTLPAGLTLGAGCVVSGTPTTAGTSSLTVTVTDSTNPTKTTSGPVSITILPAAPIPLTLTLTSLPNGTVGIPYSATIGVSGGTAPYSCSITSGTLPAGLSLGAGCVVSGTPTVAGTANLVVKATDSASTPQSVSGPVSITIVPTALVLTTSTLPNGTVGTPYTATVGVSGGTSPYSCVITGGALPAGLSLGAGCLVSGTPTAAGTSTATVKATDSSNPAQTISGPQTITIVAAPITLVLSSPPGATVGTPYTGSIGVTGGAGPYSCSITAGTLPAGLTLGANCSVTGTPTAPGSSTLTVKATDSSSPVATTTGPVTLVVSNTGLVLTTSTLPNGTVGVPYSSTIGVNGGTSPYSCTITAGTLPAGLALGAGCAVTGTPTVAGTSNLTVKATDSSSPTGSTTGAISITIAPAPLTLTTSTLPNGTVGVPYSSVVGVSGGTSPYSCTVTAGALPAGLAFGAGCTVTGTPTIAGTSNLTVKATDSSSPALTVSGAISITIAPAPLALTTSTLPNGTVGVPYSSVIGVSGGTSPYSCTVTSGALPAGLAFGAGCTVTGTPTVAGTSNLTVKATDSSSPALTVSGAISITIAPAPLTLTTSTLPNGTVGVPYSSVIGVSGGTSPYSCTVTAGALPAGLTLGAGCAVTGTPTVAGTSNLTVQATDSGNPALTTSGPISITIAPAPLTLTTSTLPNGIVGVFYSSVVGVTGGTGPYNCTVTAGALPAGLSFSAGCSVTGTPTVAGTSNLTVQATDSGSPALTTSGAISITIAPAPLTLTTSNLPNGMVGTPYSAVIGVSGGTSPYSCTIVTGTLPAGLTLGAGCAVTGIPTVAGTSNLSVKATDSASPVQTVTAPVSITITPATLTLTTSSLPNGMVGTPYSSTIGVTGGTGPYNCVFTSGTLPAGLTLGANCVVSGTPTVAGTANLTVQATDSASPAQSVSGPISITITPASLVISLVGLPNGTVGTPYSATVGATGGTAPYTCTVTSGTLPAGLTFGAGCSISGTPTVAGTSSFTVKATDSANPAQTASALESITIVAAAPTLVVSAPPAATINVPYTGVIPVTGGTGPYGCTINAGSLPAGLTLGANCTITGTPTVAGPATITVTATDSSSPAGTKTGPVTVTVNAATPVLTLSAPPNATVGTPYTGVIGVAGGTSPYSCTINAGTLPAGLTLGANCTITGTPTTAGPVTVTVTAVDAAAPQGTVTGPVTITVLPVPPLTLTGSVPNATLGVAYMQTLQAAGGIGPYTYAITAGTLPAGLSLSPSGVISGTPTAVGASSFTITATDTESTPQTESLPLVLLVVYPITPNDPEFKGPYAFLFQGYDDVLLGVLAYQTATIGSFTADGAGVVASGELDSNHQTSNPVGNTISSRSFLGTYTIGTDRRGSLTLTTLNLDGTTGQTNTYAIAIKAPISPAVTSASASMIQFDNNQLQGTKGSGSILAQTPASFTTGITGSYAFGLSGDTPCLPSCALNLAGPVASVGVFTTNGAGAISSGSSDANIATTVYANSTLSGTYGSADGNGRLELTMPTSGVPTPYPTDYAVYMVNANYAFVMSTDKHSSFILLAGTAQQQTQATFNNTAMTGAFIGYENAPTNPGLVGATLSTTLNLSTATIFRGTSVGAGTCNTTNVDQGGLDGLVNGLTGIGSGSNILNALLGTYASTGNSACTVASTGRGVLAYPAPNGALAFLLTTLGLGGNPPAPRVVYLYAPNQGYFLETGYAGLGHIEAQTGGPFTVGTFNGTYVYQSSPASSLASINTSGVITADGNGHGTSTVDTNIGVGTLNVLQLGVGNSFNYSLPNANATAGRFMSGTNVIYAISPGRFILLDENVLTTSPSVALLY